MKARVRIDLYDYDVIVGTTIEDLKKHNYVAEEGLNFETYGDKHCIIVYCLDAWEESIESVEWLRSLMHECNHAAMIICKNRGINVSVEDDEAFNYLADYIFANALKQFNKQIHGVTKHGKLRK